MDLIEKGFEDLGLSFFDEEFQASRADTAGPKLSEIHKSILQVAQMTDPIDVGDELVKKIIQYFNALKDKSWNSDMGYLQEFFKKKQKRITPKASPKVSPSQTRPSTPQSTPQLFDYKTSLGGYGLIEQIREKIINHIDNKASIDYMSSLVSLFAGVNGIQLAADDGLDRMINVYLTNNMSNFKTIEEVGKLIENYLNLAYGDIKKSRLPPTFEEFVDTTKTSGSGMKRMKRMKGGSIRIDVNAGIPPQDKPINYVPFGRYIINRNKLNDGVVMIKRPNGAFMGDLQSRRISNNLRNVFDKIVGGAIPSYQDFAKLDDDEKQYLHYVSKKANLLDKLNVPTPNKDEEERIIHRFEILRGQLVAGNDNKQMIAEFKKLLLDMSDRKLLPRRQVSDILIDIEKTFG